MLSCFWPLCPNCHINAPVPCIFSMIFSMIRHLSLLCYFVAICNMLLFCLDWLSNYIIFKLASIADILLAFVFSSQWFYHPLCITDCDISANVEDHCYFENLAGTEKISTISYPHSVMQIMRLSIFVTHILLLIQTHHPFFKIATTNASLPI